MHIDGSALVKWLGAAMSKLKTGTERALELTSDAAILYAKATKQFKRRTGAVSDSLKKSVGQTQAKVSANGGHAHYLENGTRPHVIRARKANALRFVMNGEVVFRKQVFHPGTSPRPFMKEAQAEATPLFSRLVIAAATDAFR